MKSRVKYLFWLIMVLSALFLGASIRNGESQFVILYLMFLLLSFISYYAIGEFEN